jgi:hypothetical protein
MKIPFEVVKAQEIVLLNNTISYSGVQVPCFSSVAENVQYQIFLHSITSAPARNVRGAFVYNCEQLIEVISEQTDSIESHVNLIGNEVLKILKPTKETSPLIGDADFKISSVSIDGLSHRNEQTSDLNWVNRLLIRISFIITQLENN